MVAKYRAAKEQGAHPIVICHMIYARNAKSRDCCSENERACQLLRAICT